MLVFQEEISYIDAAARRGQYLGEVFQRIKKFQMFWTFWSDTIICLRFRYAMPQVMLFYSLLCGSFGLFTVAGFCCELLVQDIGCLEKVAVGSHWTRVQSQDELAFQIFPSSIAHRFSSLDACSKVQKWWCKWVLRSMPVIFVVVAGSGCGISSLPGQFRAGPPNNLNADPSGMSSWSFL